MAMAMLWGMTHRATVNPARASVNASSRLYPLESICKTKIFHELLLGAYYLMHYEETFHLYGWQRCLDMSTCANFKVKFKNQILLFLLVTACVKVEYNDSHSELRSQPYGCSEKFNENNCIFVKKSLLNLLFFISLMTGCSASSRQKQDGQWGGGVLKNYGSEGCNAFVGKVYENKMVK